MKFLVIFAFLAFICMARTAPLSSSTKRVLILPDYHDPNHEDTVSDDDDHSDSEYVDPDDDDTMRTTTTAKTTTTTTTRSSFAFPTRDRGLIPTRRTTPPLRTPYFRTTTTTTTNYFDDFEDGDSTDNYNGDFQYIDNIRKYMQRLIEEFKKILRKITGSRSNDSSDNGRNYQYDE